MITSPPSQRTRRLDPQPPLKGKKWSRAAGLHIPKATEKPIAWPEEMKWSLPAGRLIRLDSTSLIDIPFFTSLNYDIRRAIYDTILAEAGFRQVIACPSITRTGPVKQLYGRYLIAKKCDADELKTGIACGHWECYDAHQKKEGLAEPEYRLGDLLGLMKTCKFGYLEMSDYIYSSVTFGFTTFSEMHLFVDRTPEMLLRKIRTVAFIAHVLPRNAKTCLDFIQGEYFSEEDVALIQRFQRLKKLEVNFYPSMILAASNQLPKITKPLEKVEVENVVLRVPSILYSRQSVGYPLPSAKGIHDTERLSLERPAVLTSEVEGKCQAYDCRPTGQFH